MYTCVFIIYVQMYVCTRVWSINTIRLHGAWRCVHSARHMQRGLCPDMQTTHRHSRYRDGAVQDVKHLSLALMFVCVIRKGRGRCHRLKTVKSFLESCK